MIFRTALMMATGSPATLALGTIGSVVSHWLLRRALAAGTGWGSHWSPVLARRRRSGAAWARSRWRNGGQRRVGFERPPAAPQAFRFRLLVLRTAAARPSERQPRPPGCVAPRQRLIGVALAAVAADQALLACSVCLRRRSSLACWKVKMKVCCAGPSEDLFRAVGRWQRTRRSVHVHRCGELVEALLRGVDRRADVVKGLLTGDNFALCRREAVASGSDFDEGLIDALLFGSGCRHRYRRPAGSPWRVPGRAMECSSRSPSCPAAATPGTLSINADISVQSVRSGGEAPHRISSAGVSVAGPLSERPPQDILCPATSKLST